MHINSKTLIFLSGASLLWFSGQLFASVLFQDEFPGTAVDTTLWTVGNHWSQDSGVSDGALRLRNSGDNHRTSVYTNDQFNFHEGTYVATVALRSFNQGVVQALRDNPQTELYFAVGPAVTRLDRADGVGFNIGLRWVNYDSTPSLEVVYYQDRNTRVGLGAISGVPDEVIITLNPTQFQVVFEGATLLSGDGEGTNTLAGNHNLAVFTDYRFMIVNTMSGTDAQSEAYIDSVTIIPEPSTYAAILGLFVFGTLLYRRRKR